MVDFVESVKVTVQVGAQVASRPTFGTAMFITTTGANIHFSEFMANLIRRPKLFSSSSELPQTGFNNSIKEAATAYFSQDPKPTSLAVGCIAEATQPALFYGGTIKSLNDIKGITAGTTLTFDSQSSTTTMNFGANTITTFAAAVAILQGGLTEVLNGLTARYDEVNHRLILSFPDASGPIENLFETNALTQAWGLAPGSETITILQKVPIETVTNGLDRISLNDHDSYWWGFDYALVTTKVNAVELAKWLGASSYHGYLDVIGEDHLVADEKLSIGATLSSLEYKNVGAFYNGATALDMDYKSMAYMGTFASINYNQPNSLKIGKYATLHGVTPTHLLPSQRQVLTEKRLNYYVPAATGADVHDGVTFGTWTDITSGLDWFAAALKTEVRNLFKSTRNLGKLPQTEDGVGVYRDRLIKVCEQARRNRLFAPQAVSEGMASTIRQTTSNQDFDGFLTNGYLLYIAPLSQQTQTQRVSRALPATQIFGKLSGAIQTAHINVTSEG